MNLNREQCFIAALDSDRGLRRFTKCVPVLGHLGALIMGKLFLQTTDKYLLIMAMQLLSHSLPNNVNVTF